VQWSSEHGHEPSSSLKRYEILESLSDWRFLMKGGNFHVASISSSLKKFPESDNFFEMKNTVRDFSVISGIVVIVGCLFVLFLWIVGSSNFKMSTVEQRAKHIILYYATKISFRDIAKS
jgi:ABC-type antimicrobial peptide transport system permease subunit